tara:strand:+ start:4324 stop:4656 length:333 start_codon:yes stop_codon:yes gene_type:complete
MIKPKYVIIDDVDCPEPAMVAQWVPNTGYCYMDRIRNKPSFDGMVGSLATPLQTFGITWTETDEIVTFRSGGKSFARYPDGMPRRWQSEVEEWRRPILTRGHVRRKKVPA